MTEQATERAADAAELASLRERLSEAEDTLDAIRQGNIDSLVIGPENSEQVYTLSTADRPYRLIVAGMGEGAATVSDTGIVVYANACLAGMVARPESWLVGSPVLDLARDPAALARAIDVTAGTTTRTQLDLRRSDGTHIPAMVSVSGLDIDPSTFVRCLILTDLSATRQAEEALARSHAALRERDAFLEEASQVVGLGTWEASADAAGAMGWSDNVYAITGHTPDSFDGRLESHFDLMHPDDRAAVRAAFDDAVAGRAPLRMRNRLVRPSGEVRWVEQAAVVEHEDGRPTRLLGVIQDVTAEVLAADVARTQAAELERRVALRTAELTAANHDLEAFTYSASHDLRAPLRAITAFSEILVDEYGDRLGERGLYYATRVRANGEQMSHLLESLLQLSRVSRAELRFQLVDLSDLVRSLVADLREREPDRPVTVTVHDGVRAMADVPLIRSALQNLIENAWKFTSRRDAATIEFAPLPVDGTGCGFWIRDNGAGFDQSHTDRLFQPFQRMHSTDEFPGTGMGLASVRRIVERHGGRVWAEGQVDQGSTIFVVLDADAGPGGP